MAANRSTGVVIGAITGLALAAYLMRRSAASAPRPKDWKDAETPYDDRTNTPKWLGYQDRPTNSRSLDPHHHVTKYESTKTTVEADDEEESYPSERDMKVGAWFD